jgi:membrane fusion protein, heavy metal efflux system
MKNRTFAVLALAAAAAFTGCSPRTETDPQTSSVTASNLTLTAAQRQTIQVQAVAPSQFRRTIETTGTVQFDSDQATTVLAPFSGPVSRLLVSLGQQVKAGEPLAAVASPDFAAAISAYRKALATARTDRKLADLDADLLQHHGIARREADQAETDAVNAEADRDAALDTLRSLKVGAQTIQDIRDGRPVPHLPGLIRSPIAGTVVEKLITPGQLLQAGGTPCFTVADLSRVWVMAHIFGPDIEAVHLGEPADVETDIATNSFPGTVDNISAVVDPNTRSVAVRVVAGNPEGILKKEMYVRVAIHSSHQTTGFLVPVAAVLRDDENLPFVYVENPDHSFARRRVSLGSRVGDQYEITSGLQAGDRVVVDGSLFIHFVQNQ